MSPGANAERTPECASPGTPRKTSVSDLDTDAPDLDDERARGSRLVLRDRRPQPRPPRPIGRRLLAPRKAAPADTTPKCPKSTNPTISDGSPRDRGRSCQAKAIRKRRFSALLHNLGTFRWRSRRARSTAAGTTRRRRLRAVADLLKSSVTRGGPRDETLPAAHGAPAGAAAVTSAPRNRQSGDQLLRLLLASGRLVASAARSLRPRAMRAACWLLDISTPRAAAQHRPARAPSW